MNSSTYLVHHGILGQEWGKRNGPPYPLSGGDYSRKEVSAITNARRRSRHNIYNKRHFDKVVPKGTSLNTLSWDENRTKDTDMFFAAYKKPDKYSYVNFFSGREDTTGGARKWKIKNKAMDDLRVASEDTGCKAFKKLFESDRDFYNFVIDPKRLETMMGEWYRKRFKGYKEAFSVLSDIRNSETVTEDQLDTIYRLFNYALPNDGSGDTRVQKDVKNQRTKFFNLLKKEGYGAVLDTNDAIYNNVHADAPIIVFDVEKMIPDSIKRVTTNEWSVAPFMQAGAKLCSMFAGE